MRKKDELIQDVYDGTNINHAALQIEVLVDIRDTLMGIFLMLKREDDRKTPK